MSLFSRTLHAVRVARCVKCPSRRDKSSGENCDRCHAGTARQFEVVRLLGRAPWGSLSGSGSKLGREVALKVITAGRSWR